MGHPLVFVVFMCSNCNLGWSISSSCCWSAVVHVCRAPAFEPSASSAAAVPAVDCSAPTCSATVGCSLHLLFFAATPADSATALASIASAILAWTSWGW